MIPFVDLYLLLEDPEEDKFGPMRLSFFNKDYLFVLTYYYILSKRIFETFDK